MSKEYDTYLRDHINAVNSAYRWIMTKVGLDKVREVLPGAPERHRGFTNHDASKYLSDEYKAYDDYFYGPGGVARTREGLDVDEKVQEAFDFAWLHHIPLNPHHWQHWVLIEDDPEGGEKCKALEMPDDYILEMICDWWSFSWRKGDLYEIYNWWNDYRDKMILAEETEKKVIAMLNYILDALNSEEDEEDDEAVAHSDKEDEEDQKYGVPDLKKFPMPDAKHVKSAIKFFNYIDPEHEEELARSIMKRMKEYGIDANELNVGDENRFKKYLEEK